MRSVDDSHILKQGTVYNVKLLNAVVWYVALRSRPNMKALMSGEGATGRRA